MFTIDISAAVHSRAGLGRYAEKLAVNTAAAQPDQIALFHNGGTAARVPDRLQHLPCRAVRAGYKPWRMGVLLAHLAGLGFERLLPPDTAVFHSTEHLLMPLRNTPTVLTIHDLIFKLFPAYHKKLNYWYLNWAMPIYARRATAVVTVSAATKRDVIAHYGLPADKIHVIHEAAADHFAPPTAAQIERVRRTHNLPPDYLIHLGTIEPRKNLNRLVDAVVHLRRSRHPHLHLVLAGAKGWLMDDFFARLEAEGLTDVVQALGWVDDADLPAVIGGARLAVQPSLYEGFGLPVLEHMACGQVVAAGNRSSLPEVGGEAAVYFDPENTAEMTAVIGRLLTDADEYRQRRQWGMEQAARFSWPRAARETLALYRSLAA